MPSPIMEKLRKLRSMAESGGPEGDNAKRLMDKLCKKHGIDNVEETQAYRVKCNRRINKAAVRLAFSLGLEVFHYRGKNHQIFVRCTPTEYTIFEPLMAQIQRMYLDRVTAAVHWIEGFTQATYPQEVKCGGCEAPESALEVDVIDRRHVCSLCGWKSHRFQIASDDYADGAKNARRLLSSGGAQ